MNLEFIIRGTIYLGYMYDWEEFYFIRDHQITQFSTFFTLNYVLFILDFRPQRLQLLKHSPHGRHIGINIQRYEPYG